MVDWNRRGMATDIFISSCHSHAIEIKQLWLNKYVTIYKKDVTNTGAISLESAFVRINKWHGKLHFHLGNCQ